MDFLFETNKIIPVFSIVIATVVLFFSFYASKHSY